MSIRKPLIGLSIFVILSLALTWTVFVTLERNVNGSTKSYTAEFTDASGLHTGDDVRMSGVRVGRVDSVTLVGTTLARVAFRVESDQTLYGNTKATVTYQNIIGQRYLGLEIGNYNDPRTLPDGGAIPVTHTEPSFDISALLNGFEPLFSVLDPNQIDSISTAVIRALQGDNGSLTELIAETSTLAQSFAGPDEILGEVIGNLNNLVSSLAARSGDLQTVIARTRDIFDGLAKRRQELTTSLDDIGNVVGRVSTVVRSVEPQLDQFVTRQPGFVQHIVDNKEQFHYLGDNVPALLKGLARVSQEGAYIDAYVCDFNITMVPALSAVFPMLVALATPGGKIEHSPICR